MMSGYSPHRQDDPRAWYLLILLSLAFILSMVDRTVLSLLVEPIKRDLGLSDTAIALLQGSTFAIFYALAGLPIGWLADRRDRRALVSGGIGLWSAATCACGLVASYFGLFLARIGVAVGEAALNPAAYSMLADRFSKALLGRAIGIFTAAGVVGTGMALLIGGALFGMFEDNGGWSLGGLAALRPWQATFVAVGLPGIVLAVLVFATVAEPEREANRHSRTATRSMDVLRRQGASLIPLLLGYAVVVLLGYAFVSWAPASLMRIHGLNAQETGARFGIVMLVFGGLGPVMAGLIADRLWARGRSDAPFIVMIATTGIGIIFTVLQFLQPGPDVRLALYAGSALSFTAILAAVPIVIQMIVPPDARARFSALMLVVGNVVGLGTGPLLVGVLNDRVFRDPAGIAWSLPVVMMAGGFVAVPMFILARNARVAS